MRYSYRYKQNLMSSWNYQITSVLRWKVIALCNPTVISTGSPGTGQVVLFWDGESECDGFNPCPASIEGYDGYWGVNSAGGSIPFEDGLCPGVTVDWDFGFGFANYATQYSYDLEVADDGLFGGGVHDDMYYNGQFNVDGTTSIASDGGF